LFLFFKILKCNIKEGGIAIVLLALGVEQQHETSTDWETDIDGLQH